MFKYNRTLPTDSVLRTRKNHATSSFVLLDIETKPWFMLTKPTLKGSTQTPIIYSYRIFINEALTKKRSIIYASARQAVRTGSAKGCWTIDGKIFVKRNDDKRVLIRTQEDLDTLVSRAATMQDAYCESDIEEATESTNQTRRSSYSDVVKSFPTQDDRSNDCVKS